MLYGYSGLELFLMWYACGLVGVLWVVIVDFKEGRELIVDLEVILLIVCMSLFGLISLGAAFYIIVPRWTKNILEKPLFILKRKEK